MPHQDKSCLLHRNSKEEVSSCPLLRQMGRLSAQPESSLFCLTYKVRGVSALPPSLSKHPSWREVQTLPSIHAPDFSSRLPQSQDPAQAVRCQLTDRWAGLQVPHLPAAHPALLPSHLAKGSDILTLGHTCSLVSCLRRPKTPYET